MNSFSTREIRHIFSVARRVVHHPGLDILIAPKSGPIARLLVVTPRRVGNAPERNKIRRRLKAIFHEEKLAQGILDCVVVVKVTGKELTFDELKKLLVGAVKDGN